LGPIVHPVVPFPGSAKQRLGEENLPLPDTDNSTIIKICEKFHIKLVTFSKSDLTAQANWYWITN
jgi:hypothetical protein